MHQPLGPTTTRLEEFPVYRSPPRKERAGYRGHASSKPDKMRKNFGVPTSRACGSRRPEGFEVVAAPVSPFDLHYCGVQPDDNPPLSAWDPVGKTLRVKAQVMRNDASAIDLIPRG